MWNSILNYVVVSSIINLLLLFCSENGSMVEAEKVGFTIDLIHRESPLSPFYNLSDTNLDRFRKLVAHSMSYVDDHFEVLSSFQRNTIQSDVYTNGGNYLMKLSIGTPPIEVLAVADTGSDLTWTQCQPCQQCYTQDAAIFDTTKSSTYKKLSCDSNYCKNLSGTSCGNSSKVCEYTYSYKDDSYTSGSLSNETFTFNFNSSSSGNGGTFVSLPNIVFGCGHKNGGLFTSHGSGLIGLGGGPLSLVSQLRSKIDSKFSYCLVPFFHNVTSKMNFGNNSIISSKDVVSIPFAFQDLETTYYYLTLEGISIGNEKIQDVANIVFDSGTSLTLLNQELYTKVEALIKSAINLEPVQDPDGSFPFCYNTKQNLTIPETTFHFTGGDLKLHQNNVFIRPSDDLLCFTMQPKPGLSIFGNLAQVNFQVQYDLQAKKVSLAPADCTKF